MSNPSSPAPYSPLYFLASLGAGGMTVTFFMYLMFWVPHSGQPVPVFEDIMAAFLTGGALMKVMIATAWAGIAAFAVLMTRMLLWNLAALARFRRTEAFAALSASNAGSQMLAAPLAMAMLVNGGFVVGLVFVPGLWSVVEYLFPLALVAFALIGLWGLRLYGGFLGRVLTEGGYDCARNNSFAQVLPAFAFAMVAVGLSAPASMSTSATTVAFSLIGSYFFLTVAVAIAVANLIFGLRSMLENGANPESAPTLLIMIPSITVASITLLRQNHGLDVHFGMSGGDGAAFALLTPLFMAQLVFALFGVMVLRRQGYFGRFVTGAERSAGSYALVCPGVALAVMMPFFVNMGLVDMGLVTRFSAVYWALNVPAVVMQLLVIWLIWTLQAKHFGAARTAAVAIPAE